jgi:hypothetical protein
VLCLRLGSDQHRCLHSRQQTPIRNHVEEPRPRPRPTPHGTKPKKMKNPPHLKNEAPRDHSTSCHHLPRYDLHIERMRENESESRNSQPPRSPRTQERGKNALFARGRKRQRGGKQRGRSKSRDGR